MVWVPCIFLGVYVVGYIYRFIMALFGKKVDAVEATTNKTDPSITDKGTKKGIGNDDDKKKCPFSPSNTTTTTTTSTAAQDIDLDIQVKDTAPPCKTW